MSERSKSVELISLPEMHSDTLITVLVPFSRSPKIATVVGLCKSAAYYREYVLEGKRVHLASFLPTKEDLSRAIIVLESAATWVGFSAFSNGRVVTNVFQAIQVLHCYLDSITCSNPKAHCHVTQRASSVDRFHSPPRGGVVINFNSQLEKGFEIHRSTKEEQYLLPCRLLAPRFEFDHLIDATLVEQFEACGVQNACEWCPNFQAKDIKKIGEATGTRE